TDDFASSVAIQADGRIVAAVTAINSTVDDSALARYNTNGSLDTSFGTAGEVMTAGMDGASMALQSDGKIVVLGGGFDLARYNTNGSLDTTFGTGGLVTTGRGFDAVAVKVQTDGQIVAAGTARSGISVVDFALARFTTSGALDTTFGSGGQVLTNFGNTIDFASGLAIQSDGRIVESGLSELSFFSNPDVDFALARYTTSGSLDTGFGTGGQLTTNVGQGPTADFGPAGVAIQADGKLVVAGQEVTAEGADFALARYNSNGSIDTSFGTGGQVITSFANDSVGTSVAIQADGKIVLVGDTIGPTFRD